MTTTTRVERICAVCGEQSEQVEIMSTNRFGSPDLDTRPPEMMRSTMPYWIEHCPHCGFCAPDLSEVGEGVADIVREDENYAEILQKDTLPELARYFLCWSLICERKGNFEHGAWAAVHACWDCDDCGNTDGAQNCRMLAVGLVNLAISRGSGFGTQTGFAETLTTDLYRRAGRFDLAREAANRGLEKETEEIIAKILQFQLTLIEDTDTERHTIEEATED